MSNGKTQTNRGREARSPSEIPSPGWKDIFMRVKDEISNDNLSIIAAGVAFYGFLAIFPALAAFVSTYGLLVSPSELQSDLKAIESILPPQTADLIHSQLERIVSSQSSQLGWGLLGSLVLALWSASKGMKAMIEAMNITYDEEEKRGTIKLNLIAILLTLGAIVAVIVFLGLIAVLPALIGSLGLGETVRALLNYIRWPLLAAAAIFAMAVLYRYGPSRDHPQWKWVSWGAVIATVLWLLGSFLFSVYVSNFGGYDKTYGSLGVVVILMMWFFLSAYSILLGSEINAEMEHQTAKDTTTGEDRPRGKRGAYVADTVGQSGDG
jgi:membrane protein